MSGALLLALGVHPQAANKCTGECDKSGPWGLAIVLLLCILCYFLFKSMSKHLKKVREQYPVTDAPAGQPGAGSVDTVAGRVDAVAGRVVAADSRDADGVADPSALSAVELRKDPPGGAPPDTPPPARGVPRRGVPPKS